MVKELVRCDARDYIKSIEKESLDLIILDPDYDDWKELIECGFIKDCLKVLKRSGNMLMFTKQPFDFELRNAIQPIFRREIIWSFTNGGAWVSNKMPLVSFQKIFWCVKSREFYFDPRTGQEYAEGTSDFQRSEKVFEGYHEHGKAFKKSDDGTWLRDHLHFNKPNMGAIPAKPKELIDILVRCFCPVGGLVYDPFSGSGTVIRSANERDCDVIANEIDENRCNDIMDSMTIFDLYL